MALAVPPAGGPPSSPLVLTGSGSAVVMSAQPEGFAQRFLERLSAGAARAAQHAEAIEHEVAAVAPHVDRAHGVDADVYGDEAVSAVASSTKGREKT